MADAEPGASAGSGRGRVWTHWLPVAAWAALLRYLGSGTPGELPSRPWAAIPGIDKAEHALLYGLLGFLVARAAPRAEGWRSALMAGLAGLVWGGLDEWLQSSVPGRYADPWDLVADALGAAAGGWLAFRTLRRGPRSQSRRFS